MAKVSVVHLGQQTEQWMKWIQVLSDGGFEIRYFSPMATELQQFDVQPGEIVLFHGALPNLSNTIERTRLRNPNIHIVVAYESTPKFSKQPTTHNDETTYISSPISAHKLIKTFKGLLNHPKTAFFRKTNHS